jgi:threonyl-tRNA synthetase
MKSGKKSITHKDLKKIEGEKKALIKGKINFFRWRVKLN